MPISRVNIIDHFELGRLIAKWAKQNKDDRPPDLAAIKTAVNQFANIPSRMKKLCWVQPDLDTLLIRLPNKDMLIESEQLFSSSSTASYDLPQFYIDKLNPSGPALHISNENLLYARIADYTIAQCK